MPINPKYKFLSEPGLGGNSFDAGMALWGGPEEELPRATPYIPGGLTPDIVNAVRASRQPAPQPQRTPAPMAAPVNRPAPQPAAPAQPEQFTAPEFGIPPEPPGLVEPVSQMREEDLPPEAPQAQPALPQGFEQTTLANKARAMGFDPRQLLVALAEFSAGMGNIKGKPQQSTARSFYEMQKKYEDAQAGRDQAMTLAAMRMIQPEVKPVDPLTEQYKQTQIDYLKSKMQPKPTPVAAQADPLKQQLLEEQIALTKARRENLGKPSDASLPEAAGGEPKMSPKSVKMASELRKEYQNNAVTKTTRDVKTQWNKVRDVLENPSAAGDMAAIFMFMKTLDPGSTVREGEYKSAAEATSAAGRVQTYAQNVANGSKLNPEQRLDFKRTIEKFYRAQMKEQERVNREYRELAGRSGIDPRDLMIESEDSVAPQKLRSVHDLPDAR